MRENPVPLSLVARRSAEGEPPPRLRFVTVPIPEEAFAPLARASARLDRPAGSLLALLAEVGLRELIQARVLLHARDGAAPCGKVDELTGVLADEGFGELKAAPPRRPADPEPEARWWCFPCHHRHQVYASAIKSAGACPDCRCRRIGPFRVSGTVTTAVMP